MSRIVPVMKLNEHVPADTLLVRAYGPEGVTVGAERLVTACLLAPTLLVRDLATRQAEDLRPEDLEPAFALSPQVILLGTGARTRFAPAAVRAACGERRIALESMDLGAACRTYNVLAQEGRAVVALLFPELENAA
jgi:uncharacterized protein